MQDKMLKSVEFFSGAGGLALGLHQAGFEHLALVEWDHNAAETLKQNSASILGIDVERVFCIDAREFDCSKFTGKVDLLAGGPPCQPFSNAGKNMGHRDPRDMFPVFLDAVKVIKPKAVLVENVKGLLREKFSDYLEYIIRRLMFPEAKLKKDDFREDLLTLRKLQYSDFKKQDTYKVTYQLVDAADHGIPQRRARVLFSAFRSDLGIDPRHLSATHSKESLLIDQFITGEYWKRHGIRPNNQLTARDQRELALLKNKIKQNLLPSEGLKPWRTVRDAISDLPKPVPRGTLPKIANHIQHPGARIYIGHVGSFYDYPAKALKAGTHGTPGGENILYENDKKVRYFTTREAGRLHTFPDEWIFLGPWGSCIRHVGNAVPVQLGKKFGDYLHSELMKHHLRNVKSS